MIGEKPTEKLEYGKLKLGMGTCFSCRDSQTLKEIAFTGFVISVHGDKQNLSVQVPSNLF